jgi:hypothetical protein
LKRLLEFLKKLYSPAQAYVPTLSNWTYTSGLKPKSTKVKYNSEYINCIGVASIGTQAEGVEESIWT